MSQRVFCDQPHPGGDAEAEQWCLDYHRPTLPHPAAEAHVTPERLVRLGRIEQADQ